MLEYLDLPKQGHLSTAAGRNEWKRPLIGNVKVFKHDSIFLLILNLY